MRGHHVAAAVLWATAPMTQAMTLHVPSEYATIQAGIDAATAGDSVLVAPGTYADNEVRGFRACVFMKDGVVLFSEGGSSVTTIYMPVFSGPTLIIFGSNLSSTSTTVQGFTLTSVPIFDSAAYLHDLGKVTFRDCVFHDLNGGSTNAGLNVVNGDVEVIGCRFVNCQTTDFGAGIYHHNGRIEVRDSCFENCDERAIYVSGDDTGNEAIIENCQFVNCRGSAGGAVSIGPRPGGTTIRGCTFIGNVDDYTGGGALTLGGIGSRLVEGCLFLFNETIGGNGQGGAIKALATNCTIRGNTFWGNREVYAPGGAAVAFLSVGASASMLENNIIAGCTGSPAVFRSSNAAVTSACNVFWQNNHGNTGGSYVLGPTDRTVDPMFCDPVTQNFTLMEGSPCLPENSLGCGQIGLYGLGCGPVSVDAETWSEVKSAYREGGRP